MLLKRNQQATSQTEADLRDVHAPGRRPGFQTTAASSIQVFAFMLTLTHNSYH